MHQGGGDVCFPGVAIAIQQAEFDELRKSIEIIFHSKGLIPMRDVVRVAGQLAWVGGIFPWIRGFNACLWAAITDHVAMQSSPASSKKQKVSEKKRPTHLMFAKRIV